MNRFIRLGSDYINFNSIKRMSVINRKKIWNVEIILKEYKNEGMISGCPIFMFGINMGYHKTLIWDFDTEEKAHLFIQQRLKGALLD